MATYCAHACLRMIVSSGSVHSSAYATVEICHVNRPEQTTARTDRYTEPMPGSDHILLLLQFVLQYWQQILVEPTVPQPVAYFVMTLAAPTFLLLLSAIVWVVSTTMLVALLGALGVSAAAVGGFGAVLTVSFWMLLSFFGLWLRHWSRWRHVVPIQQLIDAAVPRFGAKAVQLGALQRRRYPTANGVAVHWGAMSSVRRWWRLQHLWRCLHRQRTVEADGLIVRSSALDEDAVLLHPGLFPSKRCSNTRRQLLATLQQLHAQVVQHDAEMAHAYQQRAGMGTSAEDRDRDRHTSHWLVSWFYPADLLLTLATGDAELPQDNSRVTLEAADTQTGDLQWSAVYDVRRACWLVAPPESWSTTNGHKQLLHLLHRLCTDACVDAHFVAEVALRRQGVRLLQLRHRPGIDRGQVVWYEADGQAGSFSALMQSALTLIGWLDNTTGLRMVNGRMFLTAQHDPEDLPEPTVPEGLAGEDAEILQMMLPWLHALWTQLRLARQASAAALSYQQLQRSLDPGVPATVVVGPQERAWLQRLQAAPADQRHQLLADEPIDGQADPASMTIAEQQHTTSAASAIRPTDARLQQTPAASTYTPSVCANMDAGWLPWQRWLLQRSCRQAEAAADMRFEGRRHATTLQAQLRRQLVTTFNQDVFGRCLGGNQVLDAEAPLPKSAHRLVTDEAGDVIATASVGDLVPQKQSLVPGRVRARVRDCRGDRWKNQPAMTDTWIALVDTSTPPALLVEDGLVGLVAGALGSLHHLALAATELRLPTVIGVDTASLEQMVGTVVRIDAQPQQPNVVIIGTSEDGWIG